MNLLLVDLGNTRCVVARPLDADLAGPLQRVLEVDTPRNAADSARLAVQLQSLGAESSTVVAASVVPVVSEVLAARLPNVRLVDHTWDFPFGTAIRGAETVGADRWCNVAAAAQAGWTDALIVDAGTATTIDVLTGGVFEGGLIAPGMAFAARQLQLTAPRLWPVDFAPCDLRPGRDTSEALQIGAFHVGVQGVGGTVQALLAARPRARVALTGGLGRFLVRADWAYEPDWTLRGLRCLHDRGLRAC